MSILLDETTPVIVQGITGRIATFHTADMAEYGTNVVGGVTPGKGGTKHGGVDVFDTMKQAVSATEATASIVFVPPPFAADAIMGSGRRRDRELCVYNRRHPSAGHDQREALFAPLPARQTDVFDRPQLCGRDQSGAKR